MNRRIVIVDPNETLDYVKYWGCGLGNEVYTTNYLNSLTKDQLFQCLNLSDGDGAMLIGAGGYKYFFETTGFHAGIRSETVST